MNLAAALPIIQVVLSVLMVAVILLQQTDASVSGTFGGGFSENVAHTRRGFERILFQATIVLGILFALSAIASLLVG